MRTLREESGGFDSVFASLSCPKMNLQLIIQIDSVLDILSNSLTHIFNYVSVSYSKFLKVN